MHDLSHVGLGQLAAALFLTILVWRLLRYAIRGGDRAEPEASMMTAVFANLLEFAFQVVFALIAAIVLKWLANGAGPYYPDDRPGP